MDVAHVDVIVINQYNRQSECCDDKTFWYASFWSLHYFPPFGTCRVVVWCHRGWCQAGEVVRCDDGWAHEFNGRMVVAPVMLFIVSDYDWEYRNRQWMRELE